MKSDLDHGLGDDLHLLVQVLVGPLPPHTRVVLLPHGHNVRVGLGDVLQDGGHRYRLAVAWSFKKSE